MVNFKKKFKGKNMKYLIILVILVYAYLSILAYKYSRSTYKEITHNKFFKVLNDKGKYGEYLIYDRLKYLEKEYNEKFLFNLYIPKDNDETTELDVVLLSHKGIIVFESKNYSGWIFGSDKDGNWTQSLRGDNGRTIKNPFHNPIMQNESHIKYLKEILDNKDINIYSLITFSDRCTLKKVPEDTDYIKILNRYNVKNIIDEIYRNGNNVLDDNDINDLYNKLYPLTQVSDDVKKKHIENIVKY